MSVDTIVHNNGKDMTMKYDKRIGGFQGGDVIILAFFIVGLVRLRNSYMQRFRNAKKRFDAT